MGKIGMSAWAVLGSSLFQLAPGIWELPPVQGADP
jgi:hypothetical protein